MNLLLLLLSLSLLLLLLGLVVYLLTARKYESASSVAQSYDDWTQDGILEFYWGEHIHLGHYGSPPGAKISLKPSMILFMKWRAGAA